LQSFALLILFLTSPSRAAGVSQIPYERVLLPIVPSMQVVTGAFGSIWTAELAAYNASSDLVEITPVPGALCECPPWVPGASGRPPLVSPDPNRGGFIYVGAPGRMGKVFLSLRIQDTSRQAQTWGTSIPVVRESDVYTGRLILIDIPTDVRFRTALRIYDFDGPADRVVAIRLFDSKTGAVLVNTQAVLTPYLDLFPVSNTEAYPQFPGAAFISDLRATFPQIEKSTTIRVEIEPVTAGLRFWAFASTTNNETQHVTLAVPYRTDVSR
jgi:hypothetical protein